MAGTQGWVESPAVKKNRRRGVAGSRTTGEGVVFGLPGSLSNFFSLHVGLKGGFVRWVWVLNLVRNVSIVMDPYSIDLGWAVILQAQ